ncbi:zinc finger BED domain-containing protein 4-like [Tigriopus californicus]|uniref:zinc finger BED domain-containing protein 4-like n=1 Tax=Tigriopus californicus TaxID=6832 RepID=UPI0027DAAEB1|nr:zinc finger BED domain-containing protein 4-like [Tigriopus californicus]
MFDKMERDIARCRMCQIDLKMSNHGTTSLWRHAKSKHSEELTMLSYECASELTQHKERPYLAKSEKKLHLDRLLAKMIAKDIQPISMVEDVGFLNFCQALDPKYSLPSRRTLSDTILPSMFEEIQGRLVKQLEQTSWVCLTTDLWTSLNAVGFLAVTVHFWNQHDEDLCSFTLDCIRIHGRHTSQILGEELQKILVRNNVLSKVVVCVTDNGANMVKAVKNTKLCHIPCYAHTLNLVANGSPRNVPAVHKVIETASKIVEQTKKSSIVHEKFETIQRNQGIPVVKKLIQDVATRWNSTYEMMDRIVELRGPICELMSEQGMCDKVGCVDSNWWQAVSQCVEVLQPLYEATLELSGEQRPTGSKIIPITKMLTHHYQKNVDKSEAGSVAHDLASEVLANITRRFGIFEDFPELAISTILDPRFKSHGFQYDCKLTHASDLLLQELGKLIEVEAPFHQVEESRPKQTRTSLWEPFDQCIVQKRESGLFKSARCELNAYFQQPCESRHSNQITWWNKDGRAQFPLLYKLAMKYSIIPATSVPSERVFSVAGQVLSKRRNRLGDECARLLICLHNNINA